MVFVTLAPGKNNVWKRDISSPAKRLPLLESNFIILCISENARDFSLMNLDFAHFTRVNLYKLCNDFRPMFRSISISKFTSGGKKADLRVLIPKPALPNTAYRVAVDTD